MKFTIGIPAYKLTYLKDCIDSILNQTYTNFELVIVNDASPEDIDGLVNTYPEGKLKYYKNEVNFGAEHVVDNWNKCLSYATGEFFVLMGDDDKMCADYLEEFVRLIEKFPGCGVYHCRTIIIDENSVPVQLTEPRPEFESVYDSVLQRIEGKRLFFISDYVYRTETLKNNGGFYKMPLAWASDDISAYMGAEKNGIAHTNKPVFMYRRNSQTISTGGNIMLKMDASLMEERWLNAFIEKKAESFTDEVLRQSVANEINIYSKKKKLRTIYAERNSGFFSILFTWFFKRKKYGLSLDEILYAALMNIKENKKKRYER